MTKGRSRRRSHLLPLYIGLLITVAVVFARHAHTTEAVLIGAGAGITAGCIAGYRWGKAHAIVIQAPAPRRKAAPAAKTRQPARVKYTPHDPDAILAEMENWSSACLDGRCGECSGRFDGRACTHCTHPGARKVPGTDPDLEVNDDIPPF
jgi:hypothetical protein